jgi:hypothetical protein
MLKTITVCLETAFDENLKFGRTDLGKADCCGKGPIYRFIVLLGVYRATAHNIACTNPVLYILPDHSPVGYTKQHDIPAKEIR